MALSDRWCDWIAADLFNTGLFKYLNSHYPVAISQLLNTAWEDPVLGSRMASVNEIPGYYYGCILTRFYADDSNI